MIQFKSEYEAPIHRSERFWTINVAGWRYQKPVTKIEKCHHCGLCYFFCPTGCITDRGRYFESNLDSCKGCGICARECPNDAITMVMDEGKG